MMHRSVFAAASVALAASAQGQTSLTVRFTNNQPTGGFATSPLWFGVHNGTFDHFNSGSSASPATEALAELGVGAGLGAALGAAGVSGTITTDVVHPQFTPGETATATINVPSPATQRWFSYAAMVVPSNDFFIGNDNPLAFPIFDAAGQFMGPITIQVFGMNAWHAGTEVNDINLGPAFLVGRDIVAGTPEAGTIQPLFGQPENSTYLAMIIGQETPAYTMTDVLTAGELIGTIQVLPAPSTGVVGLVALAAIRQRRSR